MLIKVVIALYMSVSSIGFSNVFYDIADALYNNELKVHDKPQIDCDLGGLSVVPNLQIRFPFESIYTAKLIHDLQSDLGANRFRALESIAHIRIAWFSPFARYATIGWRKDLAHKDARRLRVNIMTDNLTHGFYPSLLSMVDSDFLLESLNAELEEEHELVRACPTTLWAFCGLCVIHRENFDFLCQVIDKMENRISDDRFRAAMYRMITKSDVIGWQNYFRARLKIEKGEDTRRVIENTLSGKFEETDKKWRKRVTGK